MEAKFIKLGTEIKGNVFTDKASKLMYATDASVYRELPIAVILPHDKEDIKQIINFARQERISIIPRTAGTSLAGQVVGKGIVVDVSKYMSRIIELNETERWVRVEPGVVLDELNIFLSKKNLFFGPETSTANRCMIGGMVGNNACGAHSLIYGNTRDHTLSINTILSDGIEVEFKSFTKEEFSEKCKIESLEGEIYQHINSILSNPKNQKEITSQFPDKSIKRRNTGYALDLLLNSNPFIETAKDFNFCNLLAGSEGTLAFTTEIKLNLIPLPPKEKVLICVHFNSIKEALQGNIIALKHKPGAIELMDKTIMDCTKENLSQKNNRLFIHGDPKAILIIEFADESKEILGTKIADLENELRKAKLGYHFPVIERNDISKVWDLRKAGLGVLSNIPGDAKPVPVVEDTAVNPNVLPEYIDEFDEMLKKNSLSCVYYAHAATGELHLRPILNLKKKEDIELFHTIAFETARLVKKYKGSLSGEHGDGRLRGEFIPYMIGKSNYKLLKQLKNIWDPNNIFNPGKIVDTPEMNTSLRYKAGQETPKIKTWFNFSSDQGILRAVEKCTGSGDCRKSSIIGGTMCPSFMATRDENASTRARANILREFLTNSDRKNPFNHKEIFNVLDLCLSCKACKSECPSGVDITKYKAEFLQHYYASNGISLRTRLIAYFSSINKIGLIIPQLFNFIITNNFTSNLIKRLCGFAQKRSIPIIGKYSLRTWIKRNNQEIDGHRFKGEVYFFVDEFTNYNDTEIGIKSIKFLRQLGYKIHFTKHAISGRTFLSKGLLKTAQKLATKNVQLFSELVSVKTPLIGIEPSCILTFRDEYPDLVVEDLRNKAVKLSKNCLLIEEFIIREMEKGNINSSDFTSESLDIKLHGHCHQKVLASIEPTLRMLSLPENYTVTEIKSGCCGMAGSFGYEKEHYELSMKVGELVLFPDIRSSKSEVLISAPGTSCRHQIKDGTSIKAYHPIEIIYDALNIQK